VWVLLALKYLAEQNLLNLSGRINWFVVAATAGTMIFSCAMLFGHGKGRFDHDPLIALYAPVTSFFELFESFGAQITSYPIGTTL
jgi:hypothetical protein